MNSDHQKQFRTILEPKLPSGALDYCVQLWEENPFNFKISKSRNTCLGNYKYYKNAHSISVNTDLNIYNFAITYIHEVAHMHVQLMNIPRSQRPMPHGREWKYHFQRLMIPLLKEEIFPMEILGPLALHMKNPKASSTRDPVLMTALRKYNEGSNNYLTLAQIPDNCLFKFRSRTFQKIQLRRSRALCMCVKTKQKYTIPIQAEVEAVAV